MEEAAERKFKSKISTPGNVESFLTVSDIKRTRYAHELTVAALCRMSYKAYEEREEEELDFSYPEWQEKLKLKSATAKFWFTVIHLQELLFKFLKSIRMSQFDPYLECLRKMVDWFFALDKTNYSRWLSVHIKDLENLPADAREEFKKGNFTVKRNRRKFSAIGLDHAH